jgi:hypothetical protein
MVLRKIFGPKRDDITGEWRRLHNEELYDLYSSPNITRVIKSRRIRWAGHVARMGKKTGAYTVLVRQPNENKHLEGLGVNGRIMLMGSCERGNEPSGSIKCGEFPE